MQIKTDILKQLKSKKYKPVYLLHGDEDYNLDIIAQAFEDQVLTESEKSFNLTIWYGKDVTAAQVIDSCMRYPMMAEHQLIMLKEAQDMKTIDDLVGYLKKPVPSTVFVILYKHGRLDMRKALGKSIKQVGEIYESKRLYSNEVPKWIIQYVEDRGYTIQDKNAMLIADHLGSDLSKVSNELDKIFILLPKGSEINDEFIEDHVGISKDFNVFELQDAIASRDMHKSYQIVKYFVDNPKKNPPIVVINGLFSFYSRLYKALSFVKKNDSDLAKELGFSPRNEYAAKFMVRNFRQSLKSYKRHEIEEALITLSEYDLRTKGVNNVSFDGGQLLLELIYKLVATKTLA